MVFLVAAAWAGLAGGVPPGAKEVGMLLCAEGSLCTEEARWLEERAIGAEMPVLSFTDAFADLHDAWAIAAEKRRAFDEALAHGRSEFDAGRWFTADNALGDAERLLLAVPGVIPQQSLFDLLFLRGAVALGREHPSAMGWFAQASAVAWNRTVTLPTQQPEVVRAYQAAQHSILHAKPGVLVLESPPPGAVWALNGVEIGPAAARLTVFPGPHRVTAEVPGRAKVFAAMVEVRPAEEVMIEARFPPSVEGDALAAAVRRVAAGDVANAETADVLAAWCLQRGVRRMVIYSVEGAPLAVRTVRFDAGVRRFER